MSGFRLRAGSTIAVVLVLAVFAASNFIPKEMRLKNPLLPDGLLRLGLDLQGGIHWVVGVDVDEAVKRELDFVRGNLETALGEAQVKPTTLAVEGDKLVIEVASEADLPKVREAVKDYGAIAEVSSGPVRIEAQLTPQWITEIRQRTMAQVLEVLRRRIDDPIRGIPDSVVTRQGDEQVLVQIPGGQIDRDRARSLLGSTGFLEFKIVLDRAETEDLLRAKHSDGIPEDQEILFERDRQTHRVIGAYLVKKAPDLTGDYLEDARMSFDRQQRAIVNFRFNAEGGRLFGDLTESHVGDPLGIVLDDNVYSAPVIQQRITMQGQITGRFSSQEAADLAVVLRAGALSVPVVIEEERTVGPTLGQDSIDAGVMASGMGLLAVGLFAIVYYRLSGVYATVALVANLVTLVGMMSLFQATLTLPGIAGLVLTVGMAIDANVLIFERIREELRAGKAVRASIEAGHNKALWTVLDSNLTTLFTGVILYQYGTGPIKGFAVSLCVGILTSVFTSLVIPRLLFQVYPGNRPVKSLSI